MWQTRTFCSGEFACRPISNDGQGQGCKSSTGIPFFFLLKIEIPAEQSLNSLLNGNLGEKAEQKSNLSFNLQPCTGRDPSSASTAQTTGAHSGHSRPRFVQSEAVKRISKLCSTCLTTTVSSTVLFSSTNFSFRKELKKCYGYIKEVFCLFNSKVFILDLYDLAQ